MDLQSSNDHKISKLMENDRMTPCDKIKEQLSAYVDREIDATQARALAAHLEQCPPCAEAAHAEQGIKTLVHDRASRLDAPPQLRARIRRTLAQAQPSFGQLLRELWTLHPRPAFAALAAVVLLAGALTFLGENVLANFTDPIAYESGARLEGTIICADCQLMLATHTPCAHDALAHRLVLQSKDGKLWNIVQSPQGRELLRDLSMPVSAVQTEGYLFRRAGYIQVTNFKVLQN